MREVRRARAARGGAAGAAVGVAPPVRLLVALLVALPLALAAACATASRAEAAALVAEASPLEIHVGDPVRLALTLTIDAGETDSLPMLAGTLGEFEVLAWGEAKQTTARDGKRRVVAEGTITAWRTGDLEIPPIAAAGADSAAARSAPIAVRVTSVGVTDSSEARPIKDPLSLPREWKGILLAALAAAGLAVLGFLLYRRFRRRPASLPAVPIDPRPAHEIALAELARLAGDRLVERGLLPEHFVRLTEILRRYFERRFAIPAIDLTTSETVAALRDALERPGSRAGFDALVEARSLLEDADLVKFAEVIPEAAAAHAALERARSLVAATRAPDPSREDDSPPLAAAS